MAAADYQPPQKQSLLLPPKDDQQPIKRTGSYQFIPPDLSELRVVLLGSSWSERSSVGNSILEKTVFNSEEEPARCLKARGQVQESDIVLINTPDLLLPNISEDKLREHVEHCKSLSYPGPHVFLLVLQPEDFTEEHKLRLCRVLQLFGHRSFDHSLLLISTPKKESSTEDVQDEPLKDMKKKCRYRCLKMKNLERSELLTRLGQVTKENNGDHVSCAVSEDEDAGLSTKQKSEHMSSTLNLVLCGRRGVGKTSAAKAILGRTELLSVSNSSVCVKNQGEVCEHQVSLVELPALYGKPQEAVMEESLRCVSLCDPEGVHAFLLVLPVDALSDEDKGELETLQNMFSSQGNDFTMILFTAESGLNPPAVASFLKENKDIQELYQNCGGRYVVLNIKNKQQIPELLNTVKKMRVKEPRCFTKDMFTKAQMDKVLEKDNINARLKAELEDVKKKSEMRGDDEIQSRENLEMKRILKEKEEEMKSKEEEMKRMEEDLRRKHEEDLTKMTRQLKEKQQEIEQERQLKAKQLKEQNECINKEREGRKKERAEWERSRKKLEENQRQELKRQLELSGKMIKSEKEEREKAARQFEQFRKEMKRDREAWEKERKDFWERKSQEDKQNLEEVKMSYMKLQDEYGFKRRKWTYWCFGIMLLFISYLLYYIYTH